MVQEPQFNEPRLLKLYQPDPFLIDAPKDPADPNQWFVLRYPEAYELHGSPFLLLQDSVDKYSTQVLPISINVDFFAKALVVGKTLDII